MSKEKYMVIHPDGHTDWMETERDKLLEACYKVIGSDSVENVRTIYPDICLIVDELGKIKNPPQPHNELASTFYAGFIWHDDDIAGPAVVAAIHLVDGEFDWVPLNAYELMVVQQHIQFMMDLSDLPEYGGDE